MPYRILIVHGNRAAGLILRRLLAPHYSVQVCSQPWQALTALAVQRPDIVVLDSLADHYQLVALMRAHVATVPILALAQKPGVLEWLRARLMGIRLLACPFDALPFFQLVSQMLAGAKRKEARQGWQGRAVFVG